MPWYVYVLPTSVFVLALCGIAVEVLAGKLSRDMREFRDYGEVEGRHEVKTEAEIREMVEDIERVVRNIHRDSPVGRDMDPMNYAIGALRWVLGEKNDFLREKGL